MKNANDVSCVRKSQPLTGFLSLVIIVVPIPLYKVYGGLKIYE
jgi:hypothetical protein